ncbi:MAG: type II toxin-antitoxin system VapC family toxin [Thermoflexibacteraceae bacterium]
MNRYVLDTNIVIHIIRNSSTWQYLHLTFQPLAHETFVSFASVAEVLDIATQLGWGENKKSILKNLLAQLQIYYNVENLIDDYVEISAYSQGKHASKTLPKGASAKNMGKNDLWIAATTKTLKAELITTDKDFLHLNDIFFKVHYIAQSI